MAMSSNSRPSDTLSATLAAELKALGVIPPVQPEEPRPERTAYVAWKPSYIGEEPPF